MNIYRRLYVVGWFGKLKKKKGGGIERKKERVGVPIVWQRTRFIRYFIMILYRKNGEGMNLKSMII